MIDQTISPPADRLEVIARLRSAVDKVMAVTGYTFDDNGVVHLRGRLKVPDDRAYRPLRESLEPLGYTPFLKEQGGVYEVVATPGVIPREKPDTRVNLWLFLATAASVVFAGSYFAGTAAGPDWGGGILFAVTLLSILVAHEMGHYIVGRLRGAPVSLPYFIPMPIPGTFGTMGAVIVQREPFEDRRTLIEIGLAGPLAGFLVAIPFLILGLALTDVHPPPGSGVGFGDSLLTTLIKTLELGRYVPSAGMVEHPLYIAAWFGLLVTGVDLVPAGQLDGGHVAYAILGPAARYLSYAMIAIFFVLAFTVSDSWLLWAILLLLFGRGHPPALNSAVKLGATHYMLGLIALLILVLVFMPAPLLF
jgi:membrane-associated protease RseP (regulator of RpoE activity)